MSLNARHAVTQISQQLMSFEPCITDYTTRTDARMPTRSRPGWERTRYLLTALALPIGLFWLSYRYLVRPKTRFPTRYLARGAGKALGPGVRH